MRGRADGWLAHRKTFPDLASALAEQGGGYVYIFMAGNLHKIVDLSRVTTPWVTHTEWAISILKDLKHCSLPIE